MDPPNKKRRLAPKASPQAHPPTAASSQQSVPVSHNAPAVESSSSPARVEFERFARHLQDAAMLIQRSAERSPYSNVSVLLLRWEDDVSVEPDLAALEQIFAEMYNYRTERWRIPTVPNPSIRLMAQMAPFLENARPDHLLIIYYAGYGYVGTDNQLYWACNSKDDAAKLKWDGIRCLFEDAQSDILLLLDTCVSRDISITGSHGVKQAIAAYSADSLPKGSVAGSSFTSSLAESLRAFSTKTPFTVQSLYDDVYSRRLATLAQNLPTTNGGATPLPAHPLPVSFTLTTGTKSRNIILAPLQGASSALSLPSPQHSTEDATEQANPRRDQAIDAEAVLQLKFDEHRVLVCTTFVGEASTDMTFFNKWIEENPAIAEKVAVEAMFFGPPTMLLISMSHSIWEVVRHDKVCIFLGYIGSHNFVHLYQKIVGFVGSRRSNKPATLKEVEDGKMLLEAREAAANAKRLHPEADVPETPRRASGGQGDSPPRKKLNVSGVASASSSNMYGLNRFVPRTPMKEDVEDSAEMKEAAEQLKALSHIRHHSDGVQPGEKRRSTLPDSAPERIGDHGAALNANDIDDPLRIVDSSPGRGKPRRSISKQITKQETRCAHCSHAPFKDSSSLRKHIAAAHTRPFPCAFSFAGCTSTFGSKNEWKRHISSQHLCLQYYRCSSCSASAAEGKYNEFNRKDLFTQHLRRMHAPFAIKKSLTKGESKAQNEWEARVKELQQSCLVQRRQPPQRSACPRADCSNVFEGPGSWDEWTEHVGRHMEKSEGKKMGVDRYLAQWALDEGIIEKDEDGVYKLVHDSNNPAGNGSNSRGVEQTKDSISVANPVQLNSPPFKLDDDFVTGDTIAATNMEID